MPFFIDITLCLCLPGTNSGDHHKNSGNPQVNYDYSTTMNTPIRNGLIALAVSFIHNEDFPMKYSIEFIRNLLLLSVVSLTVSAGQPLDAKEVKTLFGGNTVTAYSELKKAPVSLFYDNNGEVRGLFSNGKIGKTRWWVKDSGLICLKSKKGDLCFEVLAKENRYQKYLIKTDGTRVLAFSTEGFSPGNSNQY